MAAPDFGRALEELSAVPAKERIGPLFSALLDKEALVRWHAVTAFGAAAAELAEARLEEARDLWRVLMFRVNEESGNIAWGVPEAMGEILARSPRLADDYHRIFLSYVQDLDTDCTFIDHAPLRRGAWWGIARLAEARPDLARLALPELRQALSDCDAEARGLACLALARIRPELDAGLLSRLEALTGDPYSFDLYRDLALVPATVGGLAREALAACGVRV